MILIQSVTPSDMKSSNTVMFSLSKLVKKKCYSLLSKAIIIKYVLYMVPIDKIPFIQI